MEAEGDYIEDPLELLNKIFYFKVEITSATLNDAFWKDLYVDYNLI